MAPKEDEECCGTCAHALRLTEEDECAVDRVLKERGAADHDRLSKGVRDSMRVCAYKEAGVTVDGYLFEAGECCESYKPRGE